MCKTEVGHGWFKYTKNMPDALERPRSKLFRRIVIKDVQAAAKLKHAFEARFASGITLPVAAETVGK
jgi:hypothetical protein